MRLLNSTKFLAMCAILIVLISAVALLALDAAEAVTEPAVSAITEKTRVYYSPQVRPYITKTNDMDKEVAEIILTIAEEPVEPEPRYGFTEDEIYLLAQLLCGSAKVDGDGEYDFGWDIINGRELNHEQINLVLCVVMNRVRSAQFPDTVTDVVLQKGQFIVFPANRNTTPSEQVIEVIRNWCEAYDRGDPEAQSIPEDHLYFSSGRNRTNVSRARFRG